MRSILGITASTITTVSVVVLCAWLAAGCSMTGTAGVGPDATDRRAVDAFSGIDVSDGITVQVSTGTTQAVEIRAQPNILPMIKTTVEHGTLRIESSEELDPSVTVTAVIVADRLEAITLSGGSRGTATGLRGEHLDIQLTGGSELEGTGSAGTVTLGSSGGAQSRLARMTIGTLDVDLSGGAVVDANVTDAVHGSASGGARIDLHGDAAVDVQTSGGAEVKRS